MENEILESLKLRPGIANNNVELLLDITKDVISDVSEYINLKEGESLPKGCISIVKELVTIKCNKLGNEGLASTSASGVSENYIDGLPKELKAKLRRYRKLPR